MSSDPTWEARVERVESIAAGVRLIELGSADGAAFPAVEPGAHLTLATPSGIARSYSITERTDHGRYIIAVARAAQSRGGSASVHDDLEVGSLLQFGPPANAFALEDSGSYLLIAGGIGITPIRSMWRALDGHPRVRLVYLGRTPEETAFAEEFIGRDNARIHFSALSGRLNLWDVLGPVDDQTDLYCCAGAPLMEQVRLLTAHWRPSRVHFEDFAGVASTGADSLPFRARWQPSGETVEVGASDTLLAALRRDGVKVDSSCESGTCGTCVLRLVEGEAHHRDIVLGEGERSNRIISCVSRAAGEGITIAPIG